MLVEYLIRTDPLALALSAGWITLGGIAYLALGQLSSDSTTDIKATPGTED